MHEIKYADAGMDMKKLMLRLIGKVWIVFAAAVLGAALGGTVYAMASIVPKEEREYRAMSKIYLDFAPDETGDVYQAYNGYTWNDLMATEPILDLTMKYLPEGYTREEVTEATKAEILSDVRLLTITITSHDPDRCSAILLATGQALEERGDVAEEFRRIEVIQTTEATLVTADSRMAQAVLVGMILFIALALFGMMLGYVLDDRIQVAGDFRQVTEAPFVGYAGAEGMLGTAYEDTLTCLREKLGRIDVLTVDQGEAISGEAWQNARASDGVVVCVEYGKVHAAYLAYVIEQLQVRECKLVGVAVSGADGKFLRRYYGRI